MGSWGAIHTTYGTVHRINLEPTLFENDLEIAKSELKQYMYYLSKSKFNGRFDISLTFTKEDFDDLDKG